VSKKFIFSAVALMAFSFAGMANEIEEKKEESMRFIDGCAVLATVMTNVVIEEHCNDTGNDFDGWTIDYIYNNHYSNCLGK
jgi:hypothetical protein